MAYAGRAPANESSPPSEPPADLGCEPSADERQVGRFWLQFRQFAECVRQGRLRPLKKLAGANSIQLH
jgi:hypothetical protein